MLQARRSRFHEQMDVPAGKHRELRSRDVCSQVPAAVQPDSRIALAVQYQGRNSHRRQGATHIHLRLLAEHGARISGAVGQSERAKRPAEEGRVTSRVGKGELGHGWRPPRLRDELLGRHLVARPGSHAASSGGSPAPENDAAVLTRTNPRVRCG